MAAFYYTTNDEDPAVYHTDPNCSEGKKIESQNRVDTDTRPSGRQKCEVCA
jgi:hypothetical protein